MDELYKYIEEHTARGECQCGRCIDKNPDREVPKHSVDVHFFWVSAKNEPNKDTLKALLVAFYPGVGGLSKGPSYIEIGGALGDQGAALLLIGLGGLVGLWDVITPEIMGFSGEEAKKMAGSGFVMTGGFNVNEVTDAL